MSVDHTSYLESPYFKDPSKLYARNLQCQQMGEYCFDPQIGLYKKDEEEIKEVDQSAVEKNKKYDFIDPPKGVDRNMIECDKNPSFFDIFCGKATASGSVKKSKLEIWVDTSSTMKQVDFNGFEKQCQRERFLKTMRNSCVGNENLNIYFFEEYRTQAGSLDRVCLSSGLNDMKRIVQDLKESKTDHVLIITDIFEAQDTFIDAIDALGPSKILGLKKPMYASMIMTELKRIKKLCH